ncbi:phosphoglycerate dehydrogenase [Dermabacteraceae bacterium TAE3-ERU27]|nr:phosphoglycerate dehydrogenase [Dermabacteraceae bacterium TAE3-ERU27]
MKVLVPTTIELSLNLPAGWESTSYDPKETIPAAHRDVDVLVVWGNSDKNIADAVANCPRLRLLQGLLAGVDRLLGMDLPEHVRIASGVGLHSRTVSEHTLALLLSLVRRMPECAQAQAQRRWAAEMGGIQPLHPEGRITTLLDARVLIWGFGAIGQHLAPMLAAFGADVRGVARSAGKRAGFETLTPEQARGALAETDVLINVLPASQQTQGLFDAELFAALPAHAFFVNVGRGSSVVEEDLVRALREGTLAGAALDVAATEPLPADSPLWQAPNLIITPHAAGGRPVGAAERVAENCARLARGEELLHEEKR